MQKQKKILFLHGFYASGSCVPAQALKEAFDGKAQVQTPAPPLHPADAVRLIRDICDKEKPDILVGNSCCLTIPSQKTGYATSSTSRETSTS